jgi:hypothetical protein
MRVTVRIAVAITVTLLAQPRIVAQAPSLDETLGRAAAYLATYIRQIPGVVAEERYQQSVAARRGMVSAYTASPRVLRSDVMSMVGADHEWMSVRDVFEVDGRPVRDHDLRLQKLVLASADNPFTRARQIADESARFNLGFKRNFNLPSIGSAFLTAANQPRSRFTRSGAAKVGGVDTTIVDFKEVEPQTIITSIKGDVPSTGRFWIEPVTGRLMKSEVRSDSDQIVVDVTVTFAFVPKLNLWLPSAMDEVCTSPREIVIGHAAYSSFRKFSVNADAVIK